MQAAIADFKSTFVVGADHSSLFPIAKVKFSFKGNRLARDLLLQAGDDAFHRIGEIGQMNAVGATSRRLQRFLRI